MIIIYGLEFRDSCTIVRKRHRGRKEQTFTYSVAKFDHFVKIGNTDKMI